MVDRKPWYDGDNPTSFKALALEEAYKMKDELCLVDTRRNSGCIKAETCKTPFCNSGRCRCKHGYVMKKWDFDPDNGYEVRADCYNLYTEDLRNVQDDGSDMLISSA